jgi:co-chaperonin GroES (HSP10)
VVKQKRTWQEVNEFLAREERKLHGNRIAVLRHGVGETFGNSSIIRPDTQKYEMLQGSIVAIGDLVDEDTAFDIGRIVTFNNYHVSSFEVEIVPGEKLILDDLHATDIRWSWSE